jgi:cytidylate kinase
MSPRTTLDRFLTAHASLREKEKKTPRVRPFLTLSREAGAGGHTVGQRVADILNEVPRKAPWTVFDKELVDIVLQKHNLPQDLSKYMTEEGVHAFEDFVAELIGLHPASDTFIRSTNETILALARMGNAVIIGRGANFVTRGLPGGFHARLVAARETRLRRMATYYELNEKEVAARLKRTDEGRQDYVRDALGMDVADVLGYDCVINTTRMSFEDAARMIAGHIQLRSSGEGGRRTS